MLMIWLFILSAVIMVVAVKKNKKGFIVFATIQFTVTAIIILNNTKPNAVKEELVTYPTLKTYENIIPNEDGTLVGILNGNYVFKTKKGIKEITESEVDMINDGSLSYFAEYDYPRKTSSGDKHYVINIAPELETH